MTEQTENTDNVVPENEFARRRSIVDTVDGTADAVKALAVYYQTFRELGVSTSDWVPMVIESLPEPYRTTFGPGAERSGAVMIDLIAAFAEGGTMAAMEKLPDFIGRVLGNPDGKSSVFATLGARVGMLFAGGPEGMVGTLPPGAEPPTAEERADSLADMDAGLTAARMRIRIGKLFDEAPKMTLSDGSPDPSQAPALECTLVLRGSLPPIEGSLSTTPEGGLRLLSIVPDRNNRKVMLEQFFDYADVIAVCVQREITAERKSSIIVGAS